ncbi:hypothetical protein GCM10027423_36030 [Spirosoma arcticum]
MSTGSTSYYDLLRDVVTDPNLSADEKQKLLDELRKNSPTSDRWTFRWAIWILGLIVILVIIAIWWLTYQGQGKITIPDGLIALGSGAAGALSGLLTPGREKGSNSE